MSSPAPIISGGACGPDPRVDDRCILFGRTYFAIIHRNCPVRLVLAGEFDIGSVRDLAAAVADAASRANVLHVDLAGVQFCDLAALRTIVGLRRAGGHQPCLTRPVVLHHPSAEVARMLQLTGWHALPGLTLDHGKACSRTL